jgi:hypothetical protein
MSKIIPNSFQTPNAYVDDYMAYLTPEEFAILIYIARRILGFHKHQDRISLSQLEHGIKTRKGNVLDLGTGLSRPAIVRALQGLKTFGLIIQVASNDPAKNHGACYELQLDSKQISLAGLKERLEERRLKNRDRTKSARSVALTA